VAALAAARAVAVPVVDGPMPLDDAMSRAKPLVAAAGERLARLVEIGVAVRERRATGARPE